MQLAPSALHATAETLGGYLGWTPNELIIDDIVNLDGPHGRQIGMRLISNSSTIQLWATGGTAPETPDHAGTLAPLPEGRRWHAWVHIGNLEADRDPATVLYNAITDRLMPVFDTKPLYVGHRPWDPQPDADTEATAPTDTAATPKADTDQPAPAPGPQPEAPTEQQTPTEPPTNVVPMRPRRTPPAKPTTATADAKPRPARKRTPGKADTPAADAKPKPRPTRKRTPAKPAADKPTS